MHWSSKMQTEIALSTTEAEYIALSQAMREVLPIIWLMEEAISLWMQPDVMARQGQLLDSLSNESLS